MDSCLDDLRNYFKSIDEVMMAFVFGSRVKGREIKSSDWDIAVYFISESDYLLEEDKEYP